MNNAMISSMQLTKISSNPNALQNGTSVFVRVLSHNQGGEYVVSFLGSKFNVSSQQPLQTGTSFKAVVTISEGKVFLSPQAESNDAIQKYSGGATNSIEKLSGFFQELGLKSDTISLRLIQYFQSAGLNFNLKLASRARTIGLRFPGYEEDASEMVLFLEQKGISATEDTVRELLGLLYGDDASGNQNKGSESKNKNDGQSEADENTIAENNKEREKTICDSPDLLQALFSNPDDLQNKKEGLLTFVNHSCVNEQHWILLPFEQGSEESKITGSVHILLNLSKKNTEKMVVYAFFGGVNYKFMIKCIEKGDLADQQRYIVDFCTDKSISVQEAKQLQDMLFSCLPKDLTFDISYSKELLDDGIFTLGSLISVVKLDA